MLCSCLLVWLQPSQAAAQTDGSLEPAQLMELMATVTAAGGRFTERKFLSLLAEPLVFQGTLRYEAPDYLRKELDDAESESYEVRGERLIIDFPDGTRRDILLDQYPVVRAFVECYRGTLAGDLESLERYFHVTLQGRIDQWTLRLEPRQEALAERLSEVVIHGKQENVHSIETLEANGDRSFMTLDGEGE
jgi:hypothetical protein